MRAEGNYYARITGAETTKAQTGTSAVVVGLEIQHQAANGGWQEIEPFDASLYLSMAAGAKPFTVKKLLALEFKGDFRNPEFGVERCELICKHEEYPKNSGKLKERWELANWGGSEPAADDELEKMNAEWRATQSAPTTPAGAPASPPVPPAPPAAPPVQPPAEAPSDIPF